MFSLTTQTDGGALKKPRWSVEGDEEAENSLEGAADGGQDAVGGPQPLML